MKDKSVLPVIIISTIVLAVILWFLTFRLEVGNFWVKISISTSLLALVALWQMEGYDPTIHFDLKALIGGVLSAGALYIVFVVGQIISQKIFPFAQDQIGGVYSIGEGTPLWLVAVLLFFVTGPAEEIYWRGFLQNRLAHYFGGCKGWLLASAIYAGVHVCTWNFMLVGAAAVAGLFWGFLYWRLGNLAPVIISHAVWSSVIFVVFPTM